MILTQHLAIFVAGAGTIIIICLLIKGSKHIAADLLHDYMTKTAFKMDIGWSNWTIEKLKKFADDSTWDIKNLKERVQMLEQQKEEPKR